MTSRNFEAALAIVLAEEGGYVDHPADPGGATKMGVTQATLSAWRGYGVSKAEVKSLTRTEAAAIYRARYWDAVRGDELPAGLDLALFDCAVNSGPSRSVKLFQRALGLPEDGVIGPATLAAAQAGHPAMLIPAILSERRQFLARLRGWSVFGRGWTRRLDRIEAEAMRLARKPPAAQAASVQAPATFPPQPRKETTMQDIKPYLTSKTLWANLIGLGAILLSLFGFQTAGIDANALADAVLQAIAAISFVFSSVFRVVATKRLG